MTSAPSTNDVPMALSTDDLPWLFTPAHLELAQRLRPAAIDVAKADTHADADRACVAALAQHDLLRVAVPEGPLDVRALCLVREALGYVSPRADSIFAVTGLGTTPLRLAGRQPDAAPFRTGAAVAAFMLTERGAGSDLAALATTARVDAGGWVLRGEKCFISNAGLASHASVLATTDPALGHKGIACFWLNMAAPGVHITPTPPSAPHPLGTVRLDDVRVSTDAMLAEPGAGFKTAMTTLDAFRVSVGAAAVGMARRAFDEARRHVIARVQFGKPLAEQPLVFAQLADMAVDLDAARLLVLRAAYEKDAGTGSTRNVSIAKLAATEAAQRIIDAAVQLCGGLGVMADHPCDLLYRAIRPLRIYEGTSEIQRTIIGRDVVRGGARP